MDPKRKSTNHWIKKCMCMEKWSRMLSWIYSLPFVHQRHMAIRLILLSGTCPFFSSFDIHFFLFFRGSGHLSLFISSGSFFLRFRTLVPFYFLGYIYFSLSFLSIATCFQQTFERIITGNHEHLCERWMKCVSDLNSIAW